MSSRHRLNSGHVLLTIVLGMGACGTHSSLGADAGASGQAGSEGGSAGFGGSPPSTSGAAGATSGGASGTAGTADGMGAAAGGGGGLGVVGDGTCPGLTPAGAGTGLAFRTAVSYPTRTAYVGSMALGDFNGDGKSDLAVMNGLDDDGASDGGAGGVGGNPRYGSVNVLLNAGNGTFGAAAKYSVQSPYGVAVGDLNGDGKADVATTNFAGVSVLLNSGNGTLLAPVSYATGTSPSWVALGDFDGDGKADLAVVDSGNQPTNHGDVAVLFNQGSNAFVASNIPAGDTPRSLALGDLNGDGKIDFAVTGTEGVRVLLNGGTGIFSGPFGYATGTNPTATALGDINGDGKTDLVVSNGNTGGLSVALNVGAGAFASAVNYAANGSGYFSPVLGDVNGDGKADLIARVWACPAVAVFLGSAAGVLGAPSFHAVSDNSSSVPQDGLSQTAGLVVGDLNGDGKLDLAVATTTGVSVLLNASP